MSNAETLVPSAQQEVEIIMSRTTIPAPAPKLVPVKVELSDTAGWFLAYADLSADWNGYAVPYFTRNQATTMCEALYVDCVLEAFSWVGDTLHVTPAGCDEEIWHPQALFVGPGVGVVYSGEGWTWAISEVL